MKDKEKALRSHIREAIKIVKKRRETKKIEEEQKLRSIVRNMLYEAKKMPQWDNTGKNKLDQLFLVTNFLTELEKAYKGLRTTKNQRDSFKTHIIQNVKKTLNLERAKIMPGDQSIKLTEEDITVTVKDDELMGLTPDEQETRDEDKDKEEFRVEGEADDTTGWDEAYKVFNNIKESLLSYWPGPGQLEEDREFFYDNIIEQLHMYFMKWEGEIAKKGPTMQGSATKPELEPVPPTGGPVFE